MLDLFFTKALRHVSEMNAVDVVQLLCVLGSAPDDVWTNYKPLICRLLKRLVGLWQQQPLRNIGILTKILWSLAKLEAPRDNAVAREVVSMVLPVIFDAGVVNQASSPQLAKIVWSISELLEFMDPSFAACMPAAWKSLRAELWTRDLNAFPTHEACLSALGVAQYIRHMGATPRSREHERQSLNVPEEDQDEVVGTSVEVFSRFAGEIENRWIMHSCGQSQGHWVTKADGKMLFAAFEAAGRPIPRWLTALMDVHSDDRANTEVGEALKSPKSLESPTLSPVEQTTWTSTPEAASGHFLNLAGLDVPLECDSVVSVSGAAASSGYEGDITPEPGSPGSHLQSTETPPKNLNAFCSADTCLMFADTSEENTRSLMRQMDMPW